MTCVVYVPSIVDHTTLASVPITVVTSTHWPQYYDECSSASDPHPTAILDDIAREVHVPEQRLSQRRHLPKQLLRRPPRFFTSLFYVCPKAVLGN